MSLQIELSSDVAQSQTLYWLRHMITTTVVLVMLRPVILRQLARHLYSRLPRKAAFMKLDSYLYTPAKKLQNQCLSRFAGMIPTLRLRKI